jgi:hypothetical protein
VVVTAGKDRKTIVAVVREAGKAAVERVGMREVSFGSSAPEVESSYPVFGSHIVAVGYRKHRLSVVVVVEDNS